MRAKGIDLPPLDIDVLLQGVSSIPVVVRIRGFWKMRVPKFIGNSGTQEQGEGSNEEDGTR